MDDFIYCQFLVINILTINNNYRYYLSIMSQLFAVKSQISNVFMSEMYKIQKAFTWVKLSNI